MTHNRIHLAAILAICALLLLLTSQCQRGNAIKREAKREQSLSHQNIKALQDSLTISHDKSGKQMATIAAFIATERNLRELNASLAQELASVPGRPASIITTTVEVDKPLTITNSIVNLGDSTYGLEFDTTTSNSSISGVSMFAIRGSKIEARGTRIFKNRVTIDIALGFTEDNDEYRVWAKSSTPDVTFNELGGALIIQKPSSPIVEQERVKRFGIGIQAGYGATLSGLQPYVGVGIGYNVIRF